MPDRVRLACCQLSPTVGHAEDNLGALVRALDEAIGRGAEIVVLPELPVSGYLLADAGEASRHAEDIGGATVSAYRAASRRGVTVIGGWCEAGAGDTAHNSAVVVSDGEVVARYRKTHLWGVERRLFVAGDEEAPVVETSHGRVGLGICYDLEFPEVARGLALRGAELIAFPTSWPYSSWPRGERPMLHTLAMATARLSRVYVAVCDRGGAERGSRFLGGSIVADPGGRPIAEAATGGAAQSVLADIDLSVARDKRLGPVNDVLRDRRPELYRGWSEILPE